MFKFSSLAMCALSLLPLSLNAAARAEKKLEIEVKFQLHEQNKRTLLSWLQTHAKAQGTEKLEEAYLDNPTSSFYFKCSKGYIEALDCLRIRTSNKKGAKTCRKKTVMTAAGNEVKEENEWEIEDPLGAIEKYREEGFSDTIYVTKTPRTTYEYTTADDLTFEFVVDDVNAGRSKEALRYLGTFFEVELKFDASSPDEGLALIWELLKKIGISQATQIHRSYIHMVSNPEWTTHPEWGFATEVKLS